MVAMIGMVEKDEPMPMVINRPTTNINIAARPLLSPINELIDVTKVSTPLVALITEANPAAAAKASKSPNKMANLDRRTCSRDKLEIMRIDGPRTWGACCKID